MKIFGVTLIVLSFLMWAGLLFVHRLPVSLAGKAAAYTAILVIAEIVFWLGCLFAGAEWAGKLWNKVRRRSPEKPPASI